MYLWNYRICIFVGLSVWTLKKKIYRYTYIDKYINTYGSVNKLLQRSVPFYLLVPSHRVSFPLYLFCLLSCMPSCRPSTPGKLVYSCISITGQFSWQIQEMNEGKWLDWPLRYKNKGPVPGRVHNLLEEMCK